jgi:hypothetical protein
LNALKKHPFDINIIKQKLDSIENIDNYLTDENARKITIVLLPHGFKYSNRKLIEVVRFDPKVKDDTELC